MNTQTVAPTDLFGYDVYDNGGNKIGSVDNVWVDDASNELEFIGVKTGWLFGKSHVIPTADATMGDGSITIPYGQDLVKDAPSFPADQELSPAEESEIYNYYGDTRSTAQSPSGLPAGGENINTAAGEMNTATTSNDQEMTLSEEEMAVDKREVQAGTVRLRKVVTTEHEEVPVDLEREQVAVERIDAADTDVPTNAFQEREIEVPVMAEQPVVSKEARVTGGVRLDKTTETETQTVGGDVRSEDVVVEDDTIDDNSPTATDRSW